METSHDLKVKPHIRNDYNASFNTKKQVAGIRGFIDPLKSPRVAGIRGYSETPPKTPLVASTSEILESRPSLLPQSHTKGIQAYEDILRIS
jgi:hypothetical protein